MYEPISRNLPLLIFKTLNFHRIFFRPECETLQEHVAGIFNSASLYSVSHNHHKICDIIYKISRINHNFRPILTLWQKFGSIQKIKKIKKKISKITIG